MIDGVTRPIRSPPLIAIRAMHLLPGKTGLSIQSLSGGKKSKQTQGLMPTFTSEEAS